MASGSVDGTSGTPAGWDPDWVTVAEAARRLGMSPSWFRAWAKESSIQVVRRGNQPGVLWPSVETEVAGSRILERYQTRDDPGRDLPGVGLMTAILHKFGWSSRDLAGALGVSPANLTHWRADGVPPHQIPRLEEILGQDPESVASAGRSRVGRPRKT